MTTMSFLRRARAMRALGSSIRLRALVAVALVATVPRTGRADESRTARLTYVRARGADRCGDQDDLRDAVVARLGYDPFVADAALAVSVAIHERGSALVAIIEVRDASGAPAGVRTITSPQRDCVELGSAIALAVGLAIDPLRLGAPRAAREVVADRAPEGSAPASSSPRRAPAPRAPDLRRERGSTDPTSPRLTAERARPRASFGVLTSVGAAPAPAMGLTLQAGVRWPIASIALEGRADLPASEETAHGAVSSNRLLGSAVPCGHYRMFAACGLASAGALIGSGTDVDRPSHHATFFAAAGGRVAVEPELTESLALRFHADLLAPLVRTTLRLNAADVWTVPPVEGALGVALIGQLP